MFDFICAVLAIFFAIFIPAFIVVPVLFGNFKVFLEDYDGRR